MVLIGPSGQSLRRRRGKPDEKLENQSNFYADTHVFTTESTLWTHVTAIFVFIKLGIKHLSKGIVKSLWC